MKDRRGAARFRRGASILPSLFTVGNLFLGFWAVIKTVQGDLAGAAPLILGAIVLDALDGRIARLTGTASEFGGELDSLSDVVSFGVAPALLAYCWAFAASSPREGWLAAFLLVMCGALRLARFNVQRHVVDGRYFVGLPIPAAAGQLAALVHFVPDPIESRPLALLVLVLVVTLSLLMVSRLRYHSFKGLDLRVRRSYVNILGIVLVFLLIALRPESVLLFGACLYSLSGPAVHFWALVARRRPGGPPAQVAGNAVR